jgi:hydroxypyruvate reductase
LPPTKLLQLRQSALEIFHSALRSVDANEVTKQAITVERRNIRIVDNWLDADTPIYSIAIGKAAGPMAQALVEMLGDRIVCGVITCPEGTANDLPGTWRQFHGGHPFPNADSLAAAEAAFTLLDQANAEGAIVIFAISGGGSAMMEWPVNPDISLSDLQQANRVLVTSGATIAEVNTVRRAFSAVKGGKLAGRAADAQSITLIISDTNRDDEANVASGPTLPATNLTTANEIVQRFKLDSKLPDNILRAIVTAPESFLSPQENEKHYVLTDNRMALDVAAAHATRIGFSPVVAESISEQPIADGCRKLVEQIKALKAPVCLISGGEFSCTVVGDGVGGRNSETALRCAIAIDGKQHNTVVLSMGTDGIDGNSPAAGAIADNTTLSRSRAIGLNAEEFLARSDSYSFFSQLGDAVVTGPTGTNVRDLRILLKN